MFWSLLCVCVCVEVCSCVIGYVLEFVVGVRVCCMLFVFECDC